MNIEDCKGYIKLNNAILSDTKSGRSEEERLKVLKFAIDRAKHYEEKTGVSACDILTMWENARTYWYMNYYQYSNQPLLTESVRVFETVEELYESIGDKGFRCPYCNGVSKNPYECNSGIKLPLLNSKTEEKQICNWKVYGLFGSLDKGVYIFVKSELKVEHIFKPIAWEE